MYLDKREDGPGYGEWRLTKVATLAQGMHVVRTPC